ncbi:MAG TPA: hypothetical protein VD790_11430 [Thermoleophilaceae bacterium]|nr:hypothetical protein [Thermoleophilaceae bacterium]
MNNLPFDLQPFKDLAVDVWEDLSRTRLAPIAVALALVLALVTGFIVLPGDSAESTTTDPVVTAAVGDEEVSFTVPGEKPVRMSDIELSAPRDPFRSLGGVDAASGEQTLMAAGEQITDSVMSSTGGVPAADDTSSLVPLSDVTSTPPPSYPPTTPVDDPAPDLDPAPHAAPDPDSDSDEGSGQFGNEGHEPTSEPVTDYSYAADIQFGLVDDLRRYSTVHRLALIPSRKMPLIMYLGVASDKRTAVFMVDSRLSQGGEGVCVPRDSLCTFIEMRATPAQDEHRFRDADGNEYLLRLRGLVQTSASSSPMEGPSLSSLDGTPSMVDGSQ